MKNIQTLLKEFNEIEKQLYSLRGISSLLGWDRAVNLPKDAYEQRAEQEVLITSQIHELFTSKKVVDLVKELSQKNIYDKLSDMDRARVDIYNWRLKKLLKIPKSHVEEYSKTVSIAHHAWEEARKNESFKDFAPHLKKVFELKKQEAKYIDPKNHPYNVLLDDYERGMTMQELDKLFAELRPELSKIISKIRSSKNYEKIRSRKISSLGTFPEDTQWTLSREISSKILFNADRLVISKSTHPFMTSISADDIRITTAVRSDPMFSFGSTIHESGHALYESNFDPKIRGTILTADGSLSLAMHESQSRFWENMICKGEDFWIGYYKTYQSKFLCLKNIPLNDFYKMVNIVEPSLVRIESDELTYSMHIIIRYEIERGLLDGTIKVDDLEQVWNKKYKDYLGVVPSKPSKGVLQDVHWCDGLIGYFPTYILGSIYSAMIYNALKKAHPQVSKEIEQLDFEFIRNYLKENIHKYGASKTSKELILSLCGKNLDSKDFTSYLKEKYYKMYEIKD